MMNKLFSKASLPEEKKMEQTPHKKQDFSYAKLTIKNGDKHIGKRFKLFHKNKLIWGTEIEKAPQGYQLEYRNILVKNPTKGEFRIEPAIPFSIELSEQQFCTEQQQAYDKKIWCKV